MTYTALYRRYRPQTFDALVGETHVGKILSAAVRRGAISHAYLFCGPRGTGKTSAARILARAVNCLSPTAEGEPCNTCAACQRALQGESMDVLEIDGASNRGIDEIRDLREKVNFAPAQEKRKIYIIDEVHMLTKEAFNALLKTLEEPPEHVIFILATTEPHKLPLTVLSRCQRFDFRRISPKLIQQHLLAIAAKEGFSLTEEAATLIAKKAEGGMRDAVSLLDQCSGVSGGKVTVETVTEILGVVDKTFTHGLLRDLLAQQPAQALARVEEISSQGKDLRQALASLQETIRDCLLAVLNQEKLPQWAQQPAQVYLALLAALSDTDQRMRYAISPRISLELALFRACIREGETPSPAPMKQAAPMKQEAPMKPAAPASKPAPPAQPKQAAQPAQPANSARTVAEQAAQPLPTSISLQAIQEKWPEVIGQGEEMSPGLAEILRDMIPRALVGRKLQLDLPPAESLFLRHFQGGGEYQRLTQDAIRKVFGLLLEIDVYLGEERPLVEYHEPASEQKEAQKEEQEEPFQPEQESFFD